MIKHVKMVLEAKTTPGPETLAPEAKMGFGGFYRSNLGPDSIFMFL